MCGTADSLVLTQYVSSSRYLMLTQYVLYSRHFNAHTNVQYSRQFNFDKICAVQETV
jgi:hypothetical protein